MVEPRLHSWTVGLADSYRRVAGTVSGAMSAPLVTVSVNAGIDDALAVMAHYDIHHLLLEDRGRIVAVVSDRDLLQYGLPSRASSHDLINRLRRPVFQVARYRVVTIHAGASIEEAAAAMVEQHVSSLPVVNHADEIVGIVTSRDLLRGLAAVHAESGQGAARDAPDMS